MTLGNLDDATLAQEINDSPSYATHEFYLSNGGYRFCYLINGVVYKTTTYSGNYMNRRELDIYETLDTTGFPDWVKIPRMTGYSVGDQIVIAAEYINGTPMVYCEECEDAYMDFCTEEDCLGQYRRDVIRNLGFSSEVECYGNTVQHVDGTIYIVDLPD